MKKGILLLVLVVSAATLQAQSLKDLLYGGKLKSDSGSVVRKTDDLKSKMDTGQKKPVAVAEKGNVPADSAKVAKAPTDSLAAVPTLQDSTAVTDAPAEASPAAPAVPLKTNTKLWKEYTDLLVATLKPEIDAAKKIKKETYHVLVAYEIDTDGKVVVTNVGVTPANEMLHAQLRQYMDVTPPQLNPVLDSAKVPRKVKRSGSFTITKD